MTAQAEERCERTDLYVSQCAHCRGHVDPFQHANRERAELLASGRWIGAQYRGKCSSCGEWFGEGAAIQRDSAGVGWVAECCAEAVTS
jgi:hypothetical protein